MLSQILIFSFVLFIIFKFYSTDQTRLLFFIASYGVNQLDLLYLQIKSFVLICESGYTIKIIVHHTDILKNSSFNNFYCYNKNGFVDVIFIRNPREIGYNLVKEHRKYIVENLKEIKKYDHIGYFENDMGFTVSNLKYYLYTISLIEKYNIKNAMPGFNRFELSKCSNGDIWKSCGDTIKYVELYIIKNKPFIKVVLGYSAMWVVPKKELIKYVNDKDFINIPSGDRRARYGLLEYYSFFYWENYYKPLIPLDRIDDCFVHHMSNKYVGYYDKIQLTEFYKQMNIIRTKNGLKYTGSLKNQIINISYSNPSKYCVSLNIEQ